MITYLYRKQKAKKQARATAATNDASTGKPATPGFANAPTTKPEPINEVQILSSEEQQHKSEMRRYRFRLIFGLFLPYFIASTDVTIVATALPFIANHFGRLDQLNWIVTAFTITSTSFIPFWGQLADVFGRHAVLQSVMVIMMVGAALAAGARAWVMLLFGRALMGVAAAGILNIIKVILADKVSLEENAKNTTFFSLVGGISFGVGPVIGGYLTDVSWRWCFILNIPVAAVSMVMIFVLLRKDLVGPKPSESTGSLQRFWSRISTVDFGGLFLFVTGVTLIILGTTWGGATYAWNSAAVIASIVIGGVFFVSFFLWEFLMEPGNLLARAFPSQEPMIPLRLFRKKDVPLLSWISFSTGAAMYSIFYFVGIYFTIVKDYPASKAGTQLLYYLPGIGVGVYGAMFFCNVWPKQTWHPIMLGSILETVGFAVLAWALHTERVSVIGGMMGLAGAGESQEASSHYYLYQNESCRILTCIILRIGTGLRIMPESLHMTGIWPNEIARGMSVIDFCQPFGGTIALAMMGAVFNNKLVGQLPGGGTQSFSTQNEGSLDAINRLSPDEQFAFRSKANHAVVLAYVAVIPIIALAIVASLALGNVNITKSQKRSASGHLETTEAVESRPYILTLFGVSPL